VFGGAWGLYPDQLDFRDYQFGNVYADTNAYVQGASGGERDEPMVCCHAAIR
jgi:hypothetical protein